MTTADHSQGAFIGSPKIEVDYPQEAIAACIEGWVVVEFTVTKNGRPKGISVTGAHPPEVFDEAALEAASKLRYPLRQTESSNVTHRFVWTLDRAKYPHCNDT